MEVNYTIEHFEKMLSKFNTSEAENQTVRNNPE